MGAGVEDVVAVKVLETGVVPPVPNYREVDPELGALNLSNGGAYPIEFALRLGAGFGSQISMTLTRRAGQGPRPEMHALGYTQRVSYRTAFERWLTAVSGYDAPALEVVKHTLRVRDQGPPAKQAQAAPARTPTVPSNASAGQVTVGTPGRTPMDGPAQPPLAATSNVNGAPATGAAQQPAASGAVAQRVLSIVAEKTGYASDMLALDFDLEADLGIDTVKQAEVFASIRAAYEIPRDDQLKLRDYPTLEHVIRFVEIKRPDLLGAGGSHEAEPGAPVSQPAAASGKADPAARADMRGMSGAVK